MAVVTLTDKRIAAVTPPKAGRTELSRRARCLVSLRLEPDDGAAVERRCASRMRRFRWRPAWMRKDRP
jgi:hypothetical protein